MMTELVARVIRLHRQKIIILAVMIDVLASKVP